MKLKNALLTGLLGAPLGIFLGYTITILTSLFLKDNSYSPVAPQFTAIMGNEIKAVILQYILSAVVGFAFAFGSAIFEIEEWSITKQTAVHFILITSAMFPIAYFCYWMDHTLSGILLYIAIFVSLYIIIWLIQMYFWKKRIECINKKLQE